MSLRARALNLAQGAVESLVVFVLVDPEAALFEADAYQVARRAEGVVEARQLLVVGHLPFGRRAEEGFEFLQPDRERRAEALLFEANHAVDEVAVLFELRVHV